jgi:uncharacterized NAD-dependent epimerase/dehydratase family protein
MTTNASYQWNPAATPLVILAEGCFGESHSKFALGVIRYGSWPIAAVIDSTRTGKTVRQITGLSNDAPIVSTLKDALIYKPKALLIGTAPAGGQLPAEWKSILSEAIENGLHIINGLHFFLNEEPDLVALARTHQVQLWDVRDPEAYGRHKFHVINLQKPRPKALKVITMVGSDCAVGKMHTALELHAQTQKRGHVSAFVATGQTGILIHGNGVPLDRVIGDFMAGATEVCIQETLAQMEPCEPGQTQVIFVEGQGSLLHPAYSGVTLSLLHGSNPDAMILCHKAGLQSIRNYPHIPIPALQQLISIYETAAAWTRPAGMPQAKVVGISVNSSHLLDTEAQIYLNQLAQETSLPVTDPVRYGVDSLLDALHLKSVMI